jgi:hypothetical protein
MDFDQEIGVALALTLDIRNQDIRTGREKEL